jgi:aminoglycoside phosphotransferase
LELPSSVLAWLKRHKLRVDEHAMRAHLESRNPCYRCRDAKGDRVFLKAAVRGDPGVAHEASLLRLLNSANVPSVRHASGGLLALEWIQGKTLWEHRRKNSELLDEQIGAALFQLQLGGRNVAAKFTVRGDLGKRLLWTSPELYASLTPAALELFRQVQQRPALQALNHLLEREVAEPTLLVHGDLRQPNVMLHQKRITFIDWELAGLGDPTRDLGMLMAEDVRAYVQPRAEEELITRARLNRHARALITGWEKAATEQGQILAVDHRERVIGWAGEALLRAAYTIASNEASLPQPLLDAALAMLESPAEWSEELFS